MAAASRGRERRGWQRRRVAAGRRPGRGQRVRRRRRRDRSRSGTQRRSSSAAPTPSSPSADRGAPSARSRSRGGSAARSSGCTAGPSTARPTQSAHRGLARGRDCVGRLRRYGCQIRRPPDRHFVTVNWRAWSPSRSSWRLSWCCAWRGAAPTRGRRCRPRRPAAPPSRPRSRANSARSLLLASLSCSVQNACPVTASGSTVARERPARTAAGTG